MTDEEYELICRAQPGQQTAFNPVSVTCTVLEYIVFVVGFVIGIIMGNTANVNKGSFSFVAAAAVWMNAFYIGFFFLISAQIIKLLQKIANQTISKN